MFLTDSKEDADKVRKWSTQSREAEDIYREKVLAINHAQKSYEKSIEESGYKKVFE